MTSRDGQVYETSRINRRRATKAEMERRYQVLLDLAAANRPASVRNLYYRAVVAGLVPKTESGYVKVQRALVDLRRAGRLPYDWLTDSIRWRRRAETWDSVESMLEITARTYRRALWTRSPVTVEVWCESDSIAGVVWPVAERWDVPLLPTRGYSSLTFTNASARELNRQGRPAVIYYVGDHDPHGLEIEVALRRDLAGWCDVPVTWERLGVTWAQVTAMDLPGSRPKKDYGFPLAVEAEALPPDQLRDVVEGAITSHLDYGELTVLRQAEASERDLLYRLAGQS